MVLQAIQDGWLKLARQNISPHFDERPKQVDVDLLVIHCISLPCGNYGTPYIDDLFLGKLDPNTHPDFQDIYQLRVSAHLLIRRDGEVVQYVPFDKRAWHAGVSQFQGREKCNDFSIGIELEGTDTTTFTDEQYQQLAEITGHLMMLYPKLTKSRIVGHEHIAPGRKTDPGIGFDWDHYFHSLEKRV